MFSRGHEVSSSNQGLGSSLSIPDVDDYTTLDFGKAFLEQLLPLISIKRLFFAILRDNEMHVLDNWLSHKSKHDFF